MRSIEYDSPALIETRIGADPSANASVDGIAAVATAINNEQALDASPGANLATLVLKVDLA